LSDCGQAFVTLAALEGQSVHVITTDGVNTRRNKFLVHELHADERGISEIEDKDTFTYLCNQIWKVIMNMVPVPDSLGRTFP
jgi:hypothetical protein